MLFPRGLGLWPRLALGVTAIFAVLFGVFAVASLVAVEDSATRIMTERQLFTEMAAGEIQSRLLDSFHELEETTNFASFDPLTSDLSEERRLIADAHRLEAMSLGIYLLDPAGRIVLAEPPDTSAEGSYPSALPSFPAFAETTARPERLVSAPFRDTRTGKAAVGITVPVRNEAGNLVALLSGIVDLTGSWVAQPLAEAKKLGRTGRAEIVDSSGTVVASTEGRFMQPGSHLEFYRRMLQAGRNGIETIPHEGSLGQNGADGPTGQERASYVMAFAILPDVNWGVAMGATEEETFAAVRDLQVRLALLGSLALAALLVITLLGSRRLLRPIKVLTLASRQLASGDLGRPIELIEVGEIGVLAACLEQMRVRLKLSLEEITGWGKELEARVKERTRELEQRNRELSASAAIAAACSRTPNDGEVLDEVLLRTMETLGLGCGQVFILDEGSARLELRAHRGPMVFQPGVRFGLGEGIPGIMANAGRPQVIEDLRQVPVWATGMEPGMAFTSALGGAIAAGNKTLGAMVFFAEARVLLSNEEERLLSSVCDQIGVAVRNARLMEELAKLEALRALDKLKSELISSVSHELRTPLGFIKGYVTTLLRQDTPIEEETKREFLAIIAEETDKLQDLIENLLDSSRLQAGTLSVEKRPVDLGTLVGRLVEKASLASQTRTLVCAVPPSMPLVPADPRRIEQVVSNLLDNAIKYSPHGGRITVGGAVDERQATIYVADDGESIPSSDVELIFDPFYRRDTPLTRAVGGTGLGLAICRGIIAAHGGRIWVESTGGKGNRFVFTLPARGPVEQSGPVKSRRKGPRA